MRPSLKSEFRALCRRKSYTFEQLWPRIQAIMTRNFVWLASDFTTNDLWLLARKRGWIRETRTGRLVVTVN